MSIANDKSLECTTKSIIRCKHFSWGFGHKMAGMAPPKIVEEAEGYVAESYERGRLFACYIMTAFGKEAKNYKIKTGNKINEWAEYDFDNAWYHGYVI